jgi:hypothetical protein
MAGEKILKPMIVGGAIGVKKDDRVSIAARRA